MSEGRLAGHRIVLGVTGGIAAYKSCEVVSRLVKLGAEVSVVMTRNATQFVTPLTFESLANRPVVSDTFERPETWEVEHIALAKRADVFVVAPATANFVGKFANGIADDMLTTTVIATRAPVLIAPAMNDGMWENVAVRENMDKLTSRGVRTVGPNEGRMACGTSGMGRMAEPAEIVEAIERILRAKEDLKGLKVLVTAGPTREKIDPVRYITNRSSGKMGYAIARAAAMRGAEVTLVSGPVNLMPPSGVNLVPVETTLDLHDRMAELAPKADIVIQSAAAADYRMAEIVAEKIKKSAGEPMTLTLVENPDVARMVGQGKRADQTFVGFAAETNNVVENARGKIERKNCDLLVANDVTKPGAGFDVDTNIASLITRESVEDLPLMSKDELADRILDRVLALRHVR